MSRRVKVGYGDGPWHQGEDVSVTFPIDDGDPDNPQPVNCSTFACMWVLSTQAGVVVKRWSGGSITFVNVGAGTSNGVKVTITDADTVNPVTPFAEIIPAALYQHELWRVDEGNERVMAFGEALLRPSRRRQETS